jgi:Lrp/AsnC family leucine-responsive transcriptional regulator
MNRELDRIDKRILEELQANGRLSIVELANRVNLTNTPCSERVKRLEKSGVISKYGAAVDRNLLGFSHLSVVHVSLTATAENSLEDFNRAVNEIAEVESCLMIAGSFDYSLTVRTRDMAHFRSVLGDKINRLPGISHTNSFAVMEIVKEMQDFTFKA